MHNPETLAALDRWKRLGTGALRLTALLGTAYLLVATSAPENVYVPQRCEHPATLLRFDVSGDCGPRGRIEVVSRENECTVNLRGADPVGLPNAGRFDVSEPEVRVDLARTPLELSGYVLLEPNLDAAAASPSTDAAHADAEADADPGDAASNDTRGLDDDAGTTPDASGRRDASATPILTPTVTSRPVHQVRRVCKSAGPPGGSIDRLKCSDEDRRQCTMFLSPVLGP